MAFNRARELSGFGQKVLLICSNGSLARHLVEMRDSLPESNSELFQISAASHFIIRQARKSKNFPNYKGREERDLAFLDSLTDDMQLNALIVDEAQNSTIHELKTIITRIGEGSKIVLLGDTDQIDTPYLDSLSNGLTVIVEKFKNYDISAHITLMKGERSELATLASQVL